MTDGRRSTIEGGGPGGPPDGISGRQWRDAYTIWSYHQLGHELRACSAAIVLGSYDLGVAEYAVALYKDGYAPVVVFSGAVSAATAAWFPRGEAVGYREHALSLGMPDEAILVEERAGNTGQNIEFSRRVLDRRGVRIRSVLLVCMPYMQRRAFATCARQWPEVDIVCASESIGLGRYVRTIGDVRLVIDDLVGDLQRVMAYPARGFAIEQDVPAPVVAAYRRLVLDGFDSRVL